MVTFLAIFAGKVIRTREGTMVDLRGIAAGAAIVSVLASGSAFAGKTLDSVKAKGFIQCGVSQGIPGFSNPDASGHWTGIDVDVCRAVAAAVFGDASKVKFTPTSGKDRFTALQSGEIDVLSRNTTWTLTRDTSSGLDFTGITYHDGQGFMAKKSLGVKSVKELDGATVCVGAGTTTELNLQDYFRANNLKYTPVVFEKADEVIAAYDAGRCDVFTTDQSGLYAQRLKLKTPDEHVVLPEIISKEPLGPLVRKGDQEWGDIVRWTLFGMIDAEELGINSGNVADLKAKSTNPEIKRVLGDSDFGTALGVSNDWLFNIVKQLGNYGEVFERNLGVETPLKITRGVNALWNKGGLQYAPPIR
jgi:general L-amino acid transport system substrate-binding protein